MIYQTTRFAMLLFVCLLGGVSATAAESEVGPAGTVRGTVTLASRGTPMPHTTVTLVPLGRETETNAKGEFAFEDVPLGVYGVLAHMHALTDERKTVTVEAGRTAVVNFELRLQPVREAVTVTASGRSESVFEAFQTVTSRESYELTARAASPALGEVLENEAGIAKRSSGPGNSRPVIRGFDGDRVLILQDGIRTGTLSAQSGDHGEPVDAGAVERIEVIRGPATLLYGSNAIGGVVNIVSGHHILHQHPHEGMRGSFTAVGGTGNGMGGGTVNFEYGKDRWLLYGGGGAQATGNYRTPLGKVFNSAAEMSHAMIGLGRFGEKYSFNFSYQKQLGQYGIPYNLEGEEHDHDDHDDHDEDHEAHAARNAALARRALSRVSLRRTLDADDHDDHEDDDDHDHDHEHGHGHDHGPVRLDWHRHNYRFQTTVKQLGGMLEQFRFNVNYSYWNHKEIELNESEVGTNFFNKQLVYRGEFQQRRQGVLSGQFGVWGMHRDFKAFGAEALAPPAKQNAIALFALEEVDLERVRLQFGARLENNRFSAIGMPERSFTGASASAGLYVPTWKGGAVVANYMHSYRAPGLEELYNNGPHPGNALFEIGDPNLRRERGNGVELSLRNLSRRVKMETNVFRYQFSDFIFFNPTGEFDDGLPVAEYRQGDSRFLGADARFEGGLTDNLWLTLGFDAVDAQLTATRTPLPRIPPVRGRVGFDLRVKGVSVRPEAVIANRQWQLAPNETLTAGYAVFNLTASYTYTQTDRLHTFTANSFNLGDRLYRNHLNFLKSFAPEIGRGIRFGYTLTWF
ncbi:MAG: TonB-dependent receptor [Solibacteraceae bacterium]|nr:TonB-dependent receptor [Solibacteraceae bacterium]